MSLTTLPLSKLHLSPMNVRQTGDGDDTSDLEASILAHGMLSHLIVHKLTGKRGHYGVLAGGRRLRALQRLRDTGSLSADHPVDVEIRDDDQVTSTEISIIENTARVALPPVEEYLAFAKLAADGADVSAIATRFGCTELHVKQRMRLGQLHPDILDALAAQRLSMDMARAFASTSDLALQKRVFDQRFAQPYEVRAALNRDLVNAGVDRMLDLVTLEEYVAGGGRAEPDLFIPNVTRIEDIDILRTLYDAKVAAERDRLGLPERATMQFDHGGVGQVVEVAPELSDELHARLKVIDDRLEDIEVRLDEIAEIDVDATIMRWVAIAGENQTEVDQLVAERRRLATEGESLHAGGDYPDGPLIAVAHASEGRLVLAGVYRPFGWRPAPVGGVESANATTTGETAQTPPTAGRPAATPPPAREKPVISAFRTDRLAYSSVYQQPEAVARDEHGLSKDAVEVMRSVRRMTLGAALLGHPVGQRLAGDYLIFVLARGLLAGASGDDPADLGVHSLPRHEYDPGIARDDLSRQPGTEAQRAELDRVRAQPWMTEKNPAQALRLFVIAPHIEKTRAAAAAAVMMLNRSLNAPGYQVGVHQVLAELINIDDTDIRAAWTPDEAFFERLPKARRMEAIRAVDPALAGRLGNLGNTELTEASAAVMIGGAAARELGVSDWGKNRARNWVPDYLSFRDLSPPSDDVDAADVDSDARGVAA